MGRGQSGLEGSPRRGDHGAGGEPVQPGSIVLFHNAALHTPEALPAILETLLQEGYTFVPISELILPGEYNVDYTIDHTGRQLPAQPSSSPR